MIILLLLVKKLLKNRKCPTLERNVNNLSEKYEEKGEGFSLVVFGIDSLF